MGVILRRDQCCYNSTRIGALVGFLCIFEKVYDKLSDKAKNIISQEVEKNIYLKMRAIFLSSTLKDHYNKILMCVKEHCTQGNWYEVRNYLVVNSTLAELFYSKAEERDAIEDYLDFLFKYLEGACSFNSASIIFDYIFCHIQYLDAQSISNLLVIMNGNSQIHNNNDKNEMIRKITEYSKTNLKIVLDLSGYKNLN